MLNKTDKELYELKGLVHTLKIEKCVIWQGEEFIENDYNRTLLETASFDKEGKLLQLSKYCSGQEYLYIVYTYDSNGKLIEDLEKPLEDIYKEEELFDEDGKLIQFISDSYKGENVVSKYKEIVDSNGNLIESIYDSKDEFQRVLYIYENQINIESFNLNRNGKIISKINYHYEFDQADNWIKRVESFKYQGEHNFNRKINKIIRYRTITYY